MRTVQFFYQPRISPNNSIKKPSPEVDNGKLETVSVLEIGFTYILVCLMHEQRYTLSIFYLFTLCDVG